MRSRPPSGRSTGSTTSCDRSPCTVRPEKSASIRSSPSMVRKSESRILVRPATRAVTTNGPLSTRSRRLNRSQNGMGASLPATGLRTCSRRNNTPMRWSRASVAALVLLVGPAAADAKPPLGSPRVVRATTPADHVGRASARTEWWRLRGVNRNSGAWFELYLLRDGGLWGSSLTVVDGRATSAAATLASIPSTPGATASLVAAPDHSRSGGSAAASASRSTTPRQPRRCACAAPGVGRRPWDGG